MGIEARRERLPYFFDTSGMSRLECVSVTARMYQPAEYYTASQ